ncbi:phytoene desaturase family protein [Paenibacillus herberti]|uniref:4,4'-diaponeurosporene oxygenase n=1 Tax=Paenibacillus herberti TaxID=1619309 RepID=A0A229P1Z0_9BACL|nr:phytoene desaturase family protein [Paenibacillus herberti]OXM16118.1 phytoene desaturase [Paenibacillus herberti]
MSKKIIVVGGGLAGLSAAIRLRSDGHEVTVLEKNERAGGKLNIRSGLGYQFDTGPSILTMPWTLEKLFESAGRNLHNYLTVQRVEPQWRGLYEDGTVLDLVGDLPAMLDAIGELSPEDRERFLGYLDYCRKQYDLSMKSVYSRSLSGLPDLRHQHTLKELFAMDPLKTVSQLTEQHLLHPHLRQIFQFFTMYIGSSPYAAPAVLSQLVYVQMGLGIYFVKGGMYEIARAELKLLQELGVPVRTGAEVTRIIETGGRASGVRLSSGEELYADIVVCNMEAIPAHRSLLEEVSGNERQVAKLGKFEPSVSGHVLLLGVNRSYDKFKHHNFFFSRNPEREFHDMFVDRVPTVDPTVYVGISSKSDSSQAPDGCENWFVLTHVPPLQQGKSWEENRRAYRDLVLDKLERMGAEDLRSHIVYEEQFIPDDLQSLYGANGGSIYGVVTDRKLNGGFKIPSRSPLLEGLYFVGGSTHPGGGVPMVTLSGQLTADLIREDLSRSQAI